MSKKKLDRDGEPFRGFTGFRENEDGSRRKSDEQVRQILSEREPADSRKQLAMNRIRFGVGDSAED